MIQGETSLRRRKCHGCSHTIPPMELHLRFYSGSYPQNYCLTCVIKALSSVASWVNDICRAINEVNKEITKKKGRKGGST